VPVTALDHVLASTLHEGFRYPPGTVVGSTNASLLIERVGAPWVGGDEGYRRRHGKEETLHDDFVSVIAAE
jgi:hypothetical protein